VDDILKHCFVRRASRRPAADSGIGEDDVQLAETLGKIRVEPLPVLRHPLFAGAFFVKGFSSSTMVTLLQAALSCVTTSTPRLAGGLRAQCWELPSLPNKTNKFIVATISPQPPEARQRWDGEGQRVRCSPRARELLGC
jgi:hypothetical protein